MAVFRPFKAIRPREGMAETVSSLPYDVMNREEAKKMGSKPYSFLHVIRSEIDLDESVDAYSPLVYEKAKDNLNDMIKAGVLVQDGSRRFYIYRQIFQGRTQTGIVGCASIDDYQKDVIKKHELTRAEKERDRINHFDTCNAHTEPVFLMYRSNAQLSDIIEHWTKAYRPLYDFTSDDGVRHIVWDIADEETVQKIGAIFGDIDYLYIADGHHRSASSVNVGLKRRKQYPEYSGDEEFNYFLCVAFADCDLSIMDYNRVVKDLNGYSTEEFLKKVSNKFDFDKAGSYKPFKPQNKHEFGMVLDGKWYGLKAKEGAYPVNDSIGSLDVSILQANLLQPVLGINSPRTDKRIDFIGGIRGLGELERRVSKDMKVAFSVFPTTVKDIMTVADKGEIMPPKSTWFEPKLRSGLFIHKMG